LALLVNQVELVMLDKLERVALLVTKEQQVRKVLKASVDLSVTLGHRDLQDLPVILATLGQPAIQVYRVPQDSLEVVVLSVALGSQELLVSLAHLVS